jgi:predicted RecB family endonuclease
VLVALRREGVLVWRNEVGHGYTSRGTPVTYGLCPGSADIIACIRGRFCGIEIKAGRDRVRPDQAAWAAAVRGAGGLVVVARSVEEALSVLEDA